jgi:hypothetical protein
VSEPEVLGVAWVPLSRALLCLDCEACFAWPPRLALQSKAGGEAGCAACPKCGSQTWEPLENFLTRRREVANEPGKDQ